MMNFNKEKYLDLSNIMEDEEYYLYGELLIIANENKGIDIGDVVECFSSIMNAYNTVYHSLENPYHKEMEEWLIKNWDKTSIEMTEYITELSLRLEFKNLLAEIIIASKRKDLPKNVIWELKDTISEI